MEAEPGIEKLSGVLLLGCATWRRRVKRPVAARGLYGQALYVVERFSTAGCEVPPKGEHRVCF
jgi:hypothetical protein